MHGLAASASLIELDRRAGWLGLGKATCVGSRACSGVDVPFSLPVHCTAGSAHTPGTVYV